MTTFQWLKARGYDNEVNLWIHSKNERALLNLIREADSQTLYEYLKEVHPEKINDNISKKEIRSLMYDGMGIVGDLAERQYRYEKNLVKSFKKMLPLLMFTLIAITGFFVYLIIMIAAD